MMEKSKLIFKRFLWFLSLAICIVLTILMVQQIRNDVDSDDIYLYLVYIFIVLDVFTFSFFIGSLTLNCKLYKYNGNKIVVYAGWYHHYIKVNGEIEDEHNTLLFLTPLTMSCCLEDGSQVNITITLTNRITLKINGKLYRN